MPVPVHLPSRFFGPPLGLKSMRISSCLDGTLTMSPVRLHGRCFSPLAHPGVPSVPFTSRVVAPASSPTRMERRHPGCLGSAYSPTNTEGAEEEEAANASRVGTAIKRPMAVVAATREEVVVVVVVDLVPSVAFCFATTAGIPRARERALTLAPPAPLARLILIEGAELRTLTRGILR